MIMKSNEVTGTSYFFTVVTVMGTSYFLTKGTVTEMRYIIFVTSNALNIGLFYLHLDHSWARTPRILRAGGVYYYNLHPRLAHFGNFLAHFYRNHVAALIKT